MELTKSYSIAFKGLKNGVHNFNFEVGAPLFEAFESSEIKGGDCKVAVRVDRAETMLTLDVEVDGGVIVECDRCLEDCRVPVHFEGRLMVKFAEEIRDYDGEVMWLSPAENEVDLAQYIYESIVLSLPYQRVHPEGECNPEMLERFRIISGEEFARIESKAESSEKNDGEWAKLAALREKLEQGEGKPAAETVEKPAAKSAKKPTEKPAKK